MKRLIIATLSTLAISGMTSPVLAGEIAATNNNSFRNNVEITPFDLVTNGYQGYFTNQGIPSFGQYLWAIRANKIDAKNMIEAAISLRRLAPDKINDNSYLHHVRRQLDNLDNN